MQTLRESQPGGAPLDPLGPVGERFGRYQLIQKLGAGAMGEVYLAFDPQLDRQMALKLLRRSGDDAAIDRQLDEARAMARISHRNVVAVYDAGLEGEQPWVAMELIRGGTLRNWLEKPHPWPDTLRLLAAVGDGLLAAHRADLVHRDLKPENVLVGDEGRIAVTDFGIAHASHSVVVPRLATPGGFVDREARLALDLGQRAGTPGYMAPEQQRGEPTDARSDQFSFAVTAYEALYGQLPFAKDAGPDAAPRPPPEKTPVPDAVWRALSKALSVEPSKRHPSLQPLVESFRAAIPQRRGWVGLGALALGLVVVAGVGVARTRTLPSNTCNASADRVAQLWSTHEIKADAAALDALKSYGADWAASARATCLEVSDGRKSHAKSEREDACRAQRLDELTAVVEGLNQPPVAPLTAERIHATLTPIAACDESTALAERMPVPDRQRDAIDALHRSLAEVIALELTAEPAAVVTPATLLVDQAKKLGFAPVTAETLVEQGRALAQAGQLALAVDAYDDAVDAAEIGRDDRLRAHAQLLRAQAQLARGNKEAAERDLHAADAIAARIGAHSLIDEGRAVGQALETH